MIITMGKGCRASKERRVHLRMNKKGDLGSQIPIVMFLFLLVIVGAGIVMGSAMVFSGGYDFRAVDANLLNYKVKECMANNVIDNKFFTNFYSVCGINKNAVAGSYGLRICNGLDLESCRDAQTNIKLSAGNQDFIICAITAAEKSEKIELCGASEILIRGEKYSILTTSNAKARAGG